MRDQSSSNSTCPVRILLVDDNKLGLAARKSLLEELGYRISTAEEGKDALDQFNHSEFDLIITDYKMPRMNGLELIASIRGLKRAVPIVLISGYADALGLTETNTGADAVVPKNANEVQHLVRVVGRLLRRTPKKPAASQKSKARYQPQIAR